MLIAVGPLSSYQSRTQVDYQFGMHLKEEQKPSPSLSSKASSSSTSSQATPVSETTSWSKNANPDLLF